jgi:hypothetical protein
VNTGAGQRGSSTRAKLRSATSAEHQRDTAFNVEDRGKGATLGQTGSGDTLGNCARGKQRKLHAAQRTGGKRITALELG